MAERTDKTDERGLICMSGTVESVIYSNEENGYAICDLGTEDDEIVQCELVYYKAQPQASFSLAFQNTGDPTTVSITFDCMANQDGDIYDMNFVE